MALYDSDGCIAQGGLSGAPVMTPASPASASSSRRAASVSASRQLAAPGRVLERRQLLSPPRRGRSMGQRTAQRAERTIEAGLSDASAASEQRWTYNKDLREYVAPCPHCDQPHIVPQKQLFCCQFACGADARTGLPLRPHIGIREVTRLREQGRIIGGCGGRFKFNPTKNELSVL
eukprot:TRINITY_DN23092_c0_g1_i1.p1 TRINITY_DN23092_c0_g1~~TRINITY_DN23092_c0_g1_i1.p1  ORF type:complete len:176 (-),score=13.70 TRINITY_DN23092_c0_g1_i1:62-589(-)